MVISQVRWGSLAALQVTLWFLFQTTSFAANEVPQPSADSTPLAPHYYSVFEPNALADTRSSQATTLNPIEVIQDVANEVVRKSVNLVRWVLYKQNLTRPVDLYSRKLHFGRWINDPTDNLCMNTRAKVLVRDSSEPVQFRTERNCVVESGLWKDPYAGQDLVHRSQVQIDHMVPLKHSYQMGGWRWDFKMRCLYANFLGYRPHLVPTSVHENTSKGDRGPEKYLPPKNEARCQYIKQWLTVKLIWRLAMTEDEAQAIKETLTAENCSPESYRVTVENLNRTRNYIRENLNYCLQNQR